MYAKSVKLSFLFTEIIIIIIIIYLFWLQMGLYPVALALQQDTTHKITHHTQTKHRTQNYKNNKGHILHTINTITIEIQLQYK
jgi:hypothetical protein